MKTRGPRGSETSYGQRSNAWLVQECLTGNEEAWAALIDKFKNLVFSIPLKYGLYSDDADDVFQAVCLELLSELPRLREPEALPAWLIRVTYHKCYHWKRDQQRYVATRAQKDQEGSESEPVQVPPDMLSEVEREQALREALLELPPRCRQLIHLLFLETPPRPYREIARTLGVATGSIGFIRGRCLERLQKLLGKAGFG